MSWMTQVDNYCERIDPSFWAEPLNAVSNAGFLIAALLAWNMARNVTDWGPKLLAILLAAIGIGSFTFHTFATNWASLVDVGPITAFILAYIYLTITRYLNQPSWAGLIAVAAFFPFSIYLGKAVAGHFGPLNGSIDYVPVVVLIFAFAALVWKTKPETGRNLLIGAGILTVSLVFRTIDASICTSVPSGTHFIWHLLNSILLWWMIRTLIRHNTTLSLATDGRQS